MQESDIFSPIKEHKYLILVLLFVAIYAIFFSLVGIWWHGLYYTNVDLDIFEQALWTTINTGDILYTNEFGGSSHFGTHFSPVLFLLIPFYFLVQQTETIMVIQAVALAASAIPLYYISSSRLSRPASVCIAAIYLLYPALHGVTTCEFHEIVFFPLFFLSALAFLIRRHYAGYVICALLCLTIKEDVSLMVIMLGLWGLWLDRSQPTKTRLIHLFLIAISLITIVTAILLIIPSFNPDGIYPHFGNAYFTSNVTQAEQTSGRGTFVAQLLAPLMGVPLLAPEILILGLPGYLELFVPDYPAFWDIGQHYVAIIIPVIMTALIFGLVRLETWLSRRGKKIFPLILILLLVTSGISTVLISPSPLSIGFQHVWAYDKKIQPYKEALDPILENIDQNKEISVGSHHPFLTHLARRKNLNTVYNSSSDLILVAEGYPDGKVLKSKIEPDIFIPVYSKYDFTIYINKQGKLADRIDTYLNR